MSVTGKYELTSTKNFDEYLKAVGVNILKRTAAAAAKPSIEISETDGTYTLKTSSVFKNTIITFKLNEEFDEETADGRQCKTTMELEGNKLTQTQRLDDLSSVVVREFTDTGMKASFTCNEVTAHREYKRV